MRGDGRAPARALRGAARRAESTPHERCICARAGSREPSGAARADPRGDDRAMTLLELIQEQAARLSAAQVCFGHGTGNAFDEAAWLVLWSMDRELDALEDHAHDAVHAASIEKARALVARRIETRLPAAYLTQEAWLQNVPFFVDARTIVPRSYIAELLADGEGTGILDAWLTDRTRHVLDLCTGNGSLAVICALAYAEMTIDASDVSADALAVARRNVERHALGQRITLIESDLYERVRGPYDLIVCNPPYVTDASLAALPAEYRAEPRLALAGGADGMDLVRPIVRQAANHLSRDGVLVLEVGRERAQFEAAFPRLEVAWLETSGGEDCVCAATRAALATLDRAVH
jgi:ribosomal protein L3 glutamine methyltransferase